VKKDSFSVEQIASVLWQADEQSASGAWRHAGGRIAS
jgi:hypothetical protein